jgi:hypothetical protein
MGKRGWLGGGTAFWAGEDVMRRAKTAAEMPDAWNFMLLS